LRCNDGSADEKQTKKQHKRSIFAAVYAVNQGYDPEDLL
jgi:hypothetical protein